MNTTTSSTTLVSPPSPDLCYAVGFDAYFQGRTYVEMADKDMRAGWLDAATTGKGYVQPVAQTLAQPRSVTQLLDPEWHIVIQEELAASPAGFALNIEPELCGQWAAEHGLPCLPSAYGYTLLGDIETFITSYNDTAALWAEMVQAKNDEVAADKFDYDGALQELIEGREDEEFWRKGQY